MHQPARNSIGLATIARDSQSIPAKTKAATGSQAATSHQRLHRLPLTINPPSAPNTAATTASHGKARYLEPEKYSNSGSRLSLSTALGWRTRLKSSRQSSRSLVAISPAPEAA